MFLLPLMKPHQHGYDVSNVVSLSYVLELLPPGWFHHILDLIFNPGMTSVKEGCVYPTSLGHCSLVANIMEVLISIVKQLFIPGYTASFLLVILEVTAFHSHLIWEQESKQLLGFNVW